MKAFSFQLPSSWHVEKSEARLVALPSTSASPEAHNAGPEMLPIFIADVCVGTADQPCPPSKPPESDKSTGNMCDNPQLLWHTWPTGMTAKIWICPRIVISPGVGVTSAVAYFEIGNQKLKVSYMAGDHDKPPEKFLSDFGKSVRPK